MSLRLAPFPSSSHPLTLLILIFFLDVGGGSVSNRTRYALARIPLRWMIRECFKTNSGIFFDSDSLPNVGLNPSTLHPVVTARPDPLPVTPYDRIAKAPSSPIPKGIRALAKLEKEQPEFLKNSASGIPPGTEEEEELQDAISPRYDQLRLAKLWWILEIMPFFHVRQDDKDEWKRHFRYVFLAACGV